MSESDRNKWNLRYEQGEYATRKHASAYLEEWLPKLQIQALEPRAMDVGCGLGRNAIYLARKGWKVLAVDISEVALGTLQETAAEEGLPIVCVQKDLENVSDVLGEPEMAGSHDLVLVVRYTNLPLIGTLGKVLNPGGYLIVEEHLDTEAEVVGPREPRFRVRPGTLRTVAAGLEVIEYFEGIVEDPDGRQAAVARLVARRAG